jgi:methylmalonyl-CoA mutase N-terminal domain/subunit
MATEEDLQRVKQLRSAWEENCLQPALKDTSTQSTEFETDIGLSVKSLYTPLDLEEVDFDYAKDLGFPGQYPYTRGIDPLPYRHRPWVMRAYSGFGDPESCSQRYQKLIEAGADEIVMALDLPTQVGYDSDHVMSKGEVGKVGVAIDTLRDMEILFDSIPLNRLTRVSMLGNSFAPVALALFIALGEKQGLKPEDFTVDLQNDVLKEYVARGTYIIPVRPAIRVSTDVVGYCARHMPHWFPMTVCANHINAAGAGSTNAATYAMANGICYIDDLINKGYNVDEIAPLISIFLDERLDFFTAICNFRAVRRAWAKIIKERYGTDDPRSLALKITSYSHGGETLLEPVNNIVRITLAALAYVFGGVNYLYNAAYDEVLGTPTEDSAKIAIRTQQILAHELGLSNTVDPLAGSYFVEHLTCRIEKQILDEFKRVQDLGGAVEAVETGYYSSRINEGAIKRQRAIDRGERVSIGVHKFRTEKKIPTGAFRIDPDMEIKQVERLQRVKKERDNKKVAEALAYVREISLGDGNLVPPVLEAVRVYATVGEICDVWREVFGEHRQREYFSPR